ncbi:MAG: hypothetical protein JW727_01700 [Candidatus Aenigmarchaeota archaeon]|nr:hypothetical protein [Candidatus Aenigmarchaeota archaeon]
MIKYSKLLDEAGHVLNKRGNAKISKFTSIMSPKETFDYCSDWIRVLFDFPEEGLEDIGFNGSRRDIIDYFAGFQGLAKTCSEIYNLSHFSLPRNNPKYLPISR